MTTEPRPREDRMSEDREARTVDLHGTVDAIDTMWKGLSAGEFHGWFGMTGLPSLWSAAQERTESPEVDRRVISEKTRVLLLADALGRVLVKVGVVEDVPLTGPDLLAAADTFAPPAEPVP